MFFTIKVYSHSNCILMLNWIVWNRTIFIKMDLVLNNLQRLICHKIQPTNLHVLFVLLEWFVRWEAGNLTAVVLLGAANRISSRQHTAFLCSFFFMHFVSVHMVHPYSSMDTPTAWKKSCFIFSDLISIWSIAKVWNAIDRQSICWHYFQ